jgi:hypothetical protein
MAEKHESNWNVEDLSADEIYDAIRYLDPDPRDADKVNADDQDKDNGVVICVCLYVLLAACLSFLWFYWR